jgi:hypothetical protein
MTRHLLLAALLALSPGAVAKERAPAGGVCLDLDQVVRQEPVGADTVRFVLTGKRVLVNHLASECPRLNELNGFRQIVWDNRDGRRVCSGDRFRLIEPTQARAVGVSSFPYCRLGRFERVAP